MGPGNCSCSRDGCPSCFSKNFLQTSGVGTGVIAWQLLTRDFCRFPVNFLHLPNRIKTTFINT